MLEWGEQSTMMKILERYRIWMGFFAVGLLWVSPAAGCVFFSSNTFSSVSEFGFTLQWGTSCSTDTLQYTQVDEDPTFLSPLTQSTLGPPAVFGSTTPLSPNTLYYAQVSTNASMAGSVALGSTHTLAALPVSLPINVLSSSQLQPQWDANGNPIGTLFEIATSTDGFLSVFTTSTTINTNLTVNGLDPNTAYSFRLRAKNNDGLWTSTVSLGALATAAELPGTAGTTYSNQTNQGFRLHWTSGTVWWNPSDTFYEAHVSSDSGFGGALVTTSTLALLSDFDSLLEGTTYYSRVRAINRDGLPTSFVNFGSTVTLGPPFYTAESSGTIQSSDGAVVLTVSTGTFAEDYRLVLSTQPQLAPIASPEIPGKIQTAEAKLNNTPTVPRIPLPGIVSEIRAVNTGGAFLSPEGSSQPEVQFIYPSTDGEYVDMGSESKVRALTLAVYRLNEEKNLWVRLPSSRVDPAARTVRVSVSEMGVFSLVGQMDTNLDATYAYPVPFRAKRGDSTITFADLAQRATLRVFSLSGRLIKSLEETDGDGELVWDVRDEEGDPLSSGVYFYLIESSTDKKRGKLVIIR
jgi:hypothetical protein